MGYGFGVPERIFQQNKEIQEQTYLVTVRQPDHLLSLDKEEPEDFTPDLTRVYGENMSPADLCYVFEEWEYDEEVDDEEKKEDNENKEGKKKDDPKEQTIAAYDKVGETAHFEGNLKKAHKVMTSLDYSEEEITIAGDDAYNF